MDFFGRQDDNRRQSQWLLLVFIAALVCTALLVHVVSAAVLMLTGSTSSFTQISLPSMLFIGIIWATCLAGCFFRYLDVRAGGAVLARRFGAVQIIDARDEREKHLLNAVAQMGIASSCGQPDVFVMRNQRGINAFVVGGLHGKEALVVSEGAVKTLDEDGLKAVVAHEFGHIAQGDIPINMRLLIALGGLNAIDETGRLLTGKNPDQYAHPGVLVGYLFRGIGCLGLYAGKLIKAAFSRKREFLADASAVQFTRDPHSLARVLSEIRDQFNDELITGVYAEELAHLCFQNGDRLSFMQRLFSTHPPIQARIDSIDPHFAVKQRSKNRQLEQSENFQRMGVQTPMSREQNVNLDGVTDRIALLLSDSPSCLAALHAVFASDDPVKRERYFKALAFAYNKSFAFHVEQVAGHLKSELAVAQVLIIDHATSELRQSIKLDNRQRVLKSLEKLLVVEGEYTLMNYATLQLIRRRLDAEFPVLQVISGAPKKPTLVTQAKSFDSMGREFALLLSLLVEASGGDNDKLDAEFERALKCYTQEHHPRRSGSEADIVGDLESAFQTLYVQPRSIRQAFVQHCVEMAQNDRHIARAEQALLDLFAASLNCEAVAA